jgi:lipopolysaccharide transport system ATP-binding protein
MSDIVIKVENLSKKYILNHQSQEKYTALRDVMTKGVKNLGKKVLSPFTFHPSQDFLTDTQEDFYALSDISFAIKQGDRVGIIGRNGAGKSTLLKILSRITEPTSGKIEITGRVASLLEVGTGFHPELTGRENIYLNGAILGMSKVDIKRKFDEIVAFSEVEKFLDTPVKRYSSGMYVRLAFAVAAHLEPEILIIDEVLAVGDAQFQKKCLGKMQDVGKEGRTILFVSHNMAAVENLCSSAMMLDRGCLALFDTVNNVIQGYLAKMNTEGHSVKRRSGPVDLEVSVYSEKNEKTSVIQPGERVRFVADINTEHPIKQAGFGIGVTSMTGERIVTFHSHYQYPETWSINSKCSCTIEWLDNFLCPGTYILLAAIYDAKQLVASWENVGMLTVVASDYFGTGNLPDPSHQGHVMTRACWTLTSD